MLDLHFKNILIKALAFVVAFSTFSGVFHLNPIYYIGVTLLFILISYVPSVGIIHFKSKSILLLLTICVISLIINQPPTYFRVWNRLALYIIILIAYSPLFYSSSINKNRAIFYVSIIKVMIIFSVLSFIGYFFGINYFSVNGETLAYDVAGHFSGFTSHSMALAPISSISAIYCLSKFLSTDSKGFYKNIWIVLTLACVGATLLSASRGALGGLILGVVVVIYRFKHGRMGAFIKYILIVSAFLATTFSVWGSLSDYVIQKNESNIEKGGIIYSRKDKMAARIYEIKNNPLTGVGFCTVDERVDYVNKEKGTIEPNSSWLCVFSMTGIFGFLVFLYIFVDSFIIALKRVKDNNSAILLSGIIAFLSIHLMIEGYVFAGGSYLCGFFWLTLGVIFATYNNNLRLI